MSLDGFIADVEGKYEWITGDGSHECDTKEAFTFDTFLDHVDTIVMGRKAFEVCDPKLFKDQHIIVATSGVRKDLEHVCFIAEDPVRHVNKLLEATGKDIWIFGGGILADAFIKADMIDEYIIGIIPVILGEGIPLFLGSHDPRHLHLKRYYMQEGIAILQYTRRQTEMTEGA